MEENNKAGAAPWVVAVIALALGLGGGYYYGYSKGQNDLLASQEAAGAIGRQAVEEEVASSANPFGGTQANPLQDTYRNPFDDVDTNPFR